VAPSPIGGGRSAGTDVGSEGSEGASITGFDHSGHAPAGQRDRYVTRDTSVSSSRPRRGRRGSASLIAIGLLRRKSSDIAPAAPSDDGLARDDGGHRAGQDTDDLSLWFYRPTAAVIIWRRKYWIVLLAILVGVGTYYGARIPSPSYGSSAVIR